MDKLVKRVSLAIENAIEQALSRQGGCPNPVFPDPQELAMAAIEAMREPDDRMITAGLSEMPLVNTITNEAERNPGMLDILHAYRAMIDAALSD